MRRLYGAFNDKDVDAVLAVLHPAVDWPDMLEGRRLTGHDEVRAYWARQFEVIDPHVDPIRVDDEDGALAVAVHQVVRAAGSDEVLSDQVVVHRYLFEDGLVVAMDVLGPDGVLRSAPRDAPPPS